MARLGDGRLRLLPAGVATPACCSRAIPSATCWRRWPSSIITPLFGWRGLFFFGAVPGLVAVFIRMRVQESEAWEETKRRERETRVGFREVFLQPKVLRRFVYLVLLMGAFTS